MCHLGDLLFSGRQVTGGKATFAFGGQLAFWKKISLPFPLHGTPSRMMCYGLFQGGKLASVGVHRGSKKKAENYARDKRTKKKYP